MKNPTLLSSHLLGYMLLMERPLCFILLFLLFLFLSHILYRVRLQTYEKLADYTECIENIININDVNDNNLIL
jgi:hypothetical protein